MEKLLEKINEKTAADAGEYEKSAGSIKKIAAGLNSEIPVYYSAVKERWLLIPFEMIKVSVIEPVTAKNDLNFFEEIIIRLLAEKSRNNEELADILCLDNVFIKFITEELKNRGFLSGNNVITDSGKSKIKNMETKNTRSVFKYVFFNRFTNKFEENLKLCDEIDNNFTEIITDIHGKKLFDRGRNIGNKKLITALPLKEKENSESFITEKDILKICAEDEFRKKQIVKRDNTKYGIDDEISMYIDKIEIINKEKIYIPAKIFMPCEDIQHRKKMQITDPFAEKGIHQEMIQEINQKILEDAGENRELINLVEGLEEEVLNISDEDFENIKKSSSIRFKNKAKAVFSSNIENYPKLYALIIKFLRQYEELNDLNKKCPGSSWEMLQEKNKDFMITNYNVLVQTFIETAEKWNYFNPKLLSENQSCCIKFLKDMAVQCGFKDECSVIEKFLTLSLREIENADKNKRLNAAAAYNLVIAKEFNEHPFYKAAEEMPYMLVYLEQAKALRNESAHSSEMELDTSLYKEFAENTMSIISLMYDDLAFNYNAMGKNEESIETDINKEIKYKHLLKREIVKKYGSCLKKYSRILQCLIETEKEKRKEGNEYPLRVYKVTEAVMKEIISKNCKKSIETGPEILRSIDAEKNVRELMKKRGFTSENVPHFDKEKIEKTFKNAAGGTLNDLFYVWFLSSDSESLEKISEGSPEFPEFIKQLSMQRKHSGQKEYEDSELDYIKNNFENTIKTFLKVIL